ncbi:CBS domain-containing protein [Desulfonatronovibrio hydrogenovorans]|uniref:CBS domain-containing protein n=1 Tax=Desulfonatronovibrio hydrogenovorans TaxID=53245 RepID=UPI000490F6F7|nr:CBS domain-containing protein [Desulfonatronovibrio hydrogenovorans]
MEKSLVKELTCPVKDFPRIRENSTFVQAARALHQAQEEFTSGKGKQRILLVEDQDGKIKGKLSPFDLMRGLEPEYEKLVDTSKGAFVANYEYVIQTMREQYSFLEKPLSDLCSKAAQTKVRDFLRPVTEIQTIRSGASLNQALHRFIVTRFDSLFVVDDGKLVGVLRFSDVYREIYKTITQECNL